MSQTLHILRKDVRRLRYELCVVAAITGAFAWSHIVADSPGSPPISSATMLAYLTAILLAIAWWFLISQVVHEEALVGDRQFWITRPYDWRHLLIAKLLFVLAFVNVPLLGVQLVILAASGYRPFAGMPSLLWMQVGVGTVLLVPAIALGTVTRGFGQAVMFILSAIVSLYIALALPSMFNRHSSTGFDLAGSWPVRAMAALILCAGAAVIIRWQYSRRLTIVSRVAGLCTLLLAGALCVLLPGTAFYAILSSILQKSEAVGISVSIPDDASITFGQNQSSDFLDLQLPATIGNVPVGEVARPQLTDVTLDTSSGVHWSSGVEFAWMTYPVPTGTAPTTEYFNHLYLTRDLYKRIQNTTVSIHGSMILSVRTQTVLALSPGRRTALPGGGFCVVSPAEKPSERMHETFCSSPFRKPYDSASGSGNDIDRGTAGIERHHSEQLLSFWDAPWPDFGFSPVFTERSSCPSGCVISLVREYPRAWIKRDFTAAVRMPAAPEPHL